jgi:VanZ family protein
MGLFAIFLDAFFGLYLDLYNRTTRFDRLAHAYGTFAASILLYHLVAALTTPGGSAAFRAVLVFALGVAAGAGYELYEFAKDRKLGTRDQHGLEDTNIDLIFDFIGAFAAALFALIAFL